MSNWLTYSPVSGHGNGTITITADTLSELEDRVATIIASNSQYGLSDSVFIKQETTSKYITNITFDNLTWVTDVPSSGGTATKDNCSYQIIAKYSDNSTEDITNLANVSGSLDVPVSTEMTRQNVGTLNLTATYSGLSASTSVSAYQAAPSITGIGFTSLVWVMDVPASGGTATKDNCTYTVYAYYDTNMSTDITDVAVITGSLVVPATTATTRENVGTLTLTASYSTLTASSYITIYQEAYIAGNYLTFNILSGGSIYWLEEYSYEDKRNISYSKNNSEWINIEPSTAGTEISVNAGDVLMFKGDNPSGLTHNGYPTHFSSSTNTKFNISGNVMSLIDSINFSNLYTIEKYDAFFRLFFKCGVVNVSKDLLPATTLKDACYAQMFYGCTSLVTLPDLPATKLADSCYSQMFQGCSSLTSVTLDYLPSTTLSFRCYQYMFADCTSLITAPELPATTSKYYCYYAMFQNCTSLTTAPELPATTLAEYCYTGMFGGCTSLTQAPELPANTLAKNCYERMLQSCTKLNYIKCLATDISATDCTKFWVYGVASTGTFVKNPNMTSWPRNDSGIPSGWTVLDNGILLTGITISDLVWVTNVPASGGTATKDNCSYRIIANYSDGTTSEVTSEAIVSGSQIVESSQITSAHTAGTLTLTATYSGYSAEASVTIMQDGYNPPTPPSPTGSSEYLTFTILSAGTINWRASDASITRTIEYKLNNGAWTSITSNTGSSAPTITVNSGDKLQFRGNNTEYKTSGSEYNSFSGSTAYFNLSGNILSLFYGDNFDAQTAPTIFELGGIFQSTNVIDAGGLLLPNIVRRYCYFEMFCFCTKLTTAPVLPATTLEFKCYAAMFYGCTSLNYIKCLATDISEKDCTEDWVNGVAPTGTFVKASSMTSWTRGSYGIPSGWTVTNVS